MAWTQNPAGALPFRMRSRRSFLKLNAWWLKFRSGWGTISLFLGVPNATFRDFWGCTPAMAWTQNLLGICLVGCAPDASFLGFARWLKFLRRSFLTLRWSFPQASKSQVAQRFSLFEATWTFPEFGHGVVIRPSRLMLRKGFPCWR